MTISLCLKCGRQKVGAFSPCPHCGFEPETDEALTKSLIMSDHHFTIEELEKAGQKIKRGEDIEYDEQMLEAMWVTKKQADEATRLAGRRFFSCLTLILVVITAITYLVLR